MRTFPKADIYDDYDFRVEVIEDDITSTQRWSEIHEVIFKHDGKHYRTTYSQGLTEYQDERPFEHDTVIECVEVHEVEKIVKAWEPVED
jgi:hypothetical protein